MAKIVMWSSSIIEWILDVQALIDCMHLALLVFKKLTTPPSFPTHIDSGYYLLNRTTIGRIVCLNATICSISELYTRIVWSSAHVEINLFIPITL